MSLTTRGYGPGKLSPTRGLGRVRGIVVEFVQKLSAVFTIVRRRVGDLTIVRKESADHER